MPVPVVVGGLLSSILAGFAWLFRSRIGIWIAEALAFFGLVFVTDQLLMEPALGFFENQVENVGLPLDLIQWLGVLNVDVYITMIFSAYATVFAVRAASSYRSVRLGKRVTP